MKIEKLVLHNFGVYRGSQTLYLTPKKPNIESSITLIWGKNGCGKTTILDAFQIVLFGKHARFLSKTNQPYETIVRESIHKGTFESTGQATARLELDFTASTEGVSTQYCIGRSWRVVDTKLIEELRVTQNNIYSETLSKNWSDQVDRFFPTRLSNLYFFDGEQVDKYSSALALSQLLKDVLGELLGVDMIDRLDEDLLKYQQEQLKQFSCEEKPGEVIKTELIIENLETDIKSLEIERASLGTNKVDKKSIELSSIEALFRKLGGDLFEQRTSVEKRYKELNDEILLLEEELRELATTEVPFFLVKILLESTINRFTLTIENKATDQRSDNFAERDNFILSKLSELKVSPDKIVELEKILASNLAVLRHKKNDSGSIKHLDEEGYNDIKIMLSKLVDSRTESVSSKLIQIGKIRREAEDIEQALNAIPEAEEIKEVTEKRNILLDEIKVAEAELLAIERDLVRKKNNLDIQKKKLTDLVLTWTKMKHIDESTRRIFQHTVKVKETLSKLRKSVLSEGMKDVERLATQCFCQIAHKNASYKTIQIDVCSYEILLVRNDGASVGVDQLSSGERQLFCYALIWALRTASGRPLPFVMDTPLSRLDTKHRKNIAERYIPRVSHQVVILSTDEEIVGTQYKHLYPQIGRVYNLVFDEQTNSAKISDGYKEQTEDS